MKVVYIAGPFRDDSAWEIENNVRRAEQLALAVWRSGAAALCPHANTRFFQGAAADEVFLKGDLVMLARCDAVILTPNWQHSSGALDEIEHAYLFKIPVFTFFACYKLWLEHGIIKENQETLYTKALQLREACRAKAGTRAESGAASLPRAD